MFAFALTVLFVAAALFAVAVLAGSYARGFAAFGELRRAAANCDETVTATIRIFDPAAPKLRIVSSNAFSRQQQTALRAAA